ncbi:hypothetical protein LNKW23_34270 [Paralimibaculum aggregatum]|uniref:Uncharacterized protein n=1 Tax=Paralimibaculum aggregatum TaxID=3036245 RepID=A0ABQ6LLZ7_9RHOB|nr:hypothetical protein LNKW23_34270 [Limibaculum sp. NKW23]
MASRIASPPTTVPGAESGAMPPILIGQSAAKAAPLVSANAIAEAPSRLRRVKLVMMNSLFGLAARRISLSVFWPAQWRRLAATNSPEPK